MIPRRLEGKDFMRIVAEETMALVIDYQERLVPVMYHTEELIRNSSILLQGLKALEIPMVVSQQYTKGLGMTVPSIREAVGEHFTYLDKLTFSCAEDMQLLGRLQEIGRKNIILCGMEAHICVLQTAIDLIAKGFTVILVEDCISSRREADKAVAVRRAESEGAILTTYEAILFELTRVAKTDVFRTISGLTK